MARDLESRRKVRALEAKRDALLQKKAAATVELKKVRAELSVRRKPNGR